MGFDDYFFKIPHGRYDEGVFLGGHHSGKALHIDQVLWQNIGKNWRGKKLVAAWPLHETATLLDLVSDCIFLPDRGAGGEPGCGDSPPALAPLELALLKRAACVSMIQPGDVFYFTGGIPHVTLSVGMDVNITAYESIITLNKTHVKHFLSQSVNNSGFAVQGMENYWKMGMPEKELKDVKLDMVDRLEDIANRWLTSLEWLQVGSENFGRVVHLKKTEHRFRCEGKTP